MVSYTRKTNPDAIPTVSKSAVAQMLVSSPHAHDMVELVKRHLKESVGCESVGILVEEVGRRTTDVLSQAAGSAITEAARDAAHDANELRVYIATVVRPYECRAALAYQLEDAERTSVTPVACTTPFAAHGSRLDNALSKFYAAFHEQCRAWQNHMLHCVLVDTRLGLDKFAIDGEVEWLSMDFFRGYLLENDVGDYFQHAGTATLGRVFGITAAHGVPALVATIGSHARRKELFADYHDCAASLMALCDEFQVGHSP